MGIKNKPDIGLLIDAYIVNVDNFIASNGVGAITGPILNNLLNEGNSILTDIKDSYYNLLSETRTALSTTYDNTATNSLWEVPAPTETQGAIDKLITKISSNASLFVAFVDENGIDIEAEVGNPLKPFGSFTAALSALPLFASNCKVVVEGGSFTEDVTIQRNNFFLDCQGSSITGAFWFKDCNDVGADFTGTEVTANTSISALRVTGTSGNIKKITGGKFIQPLGGSCVSGNDAYLISCQFVATGTSFGVTLTDSKLLMCTSLTAGGVNVNNNGSIYRSINSVFEFCDFEDTGVNMNCYNTKEFNSFYNCTFKSDGNCIKGEGNIGLKGRFQDCEMESLSDNCVSMGGNSNRLAFYGCKMIGNTSTVDLSMLNVVTNARTGFTPLTSIFDNCEMFSNVGAIFNEPVSYDAADTGVTLVKYCTYDKDFVAAIPAKLIEQFVTNTGATGTNTGLQDV